MFEGFNNEEIVFTYHLYKNMLEGYEDVLENKGIHHAVNTPFGEVTFFVEFTEEQLNDMLNQDKLAVLRSTVAKLEPVVDLIRDAEPEMVSRMYKAAVPEEKSPSSDEETEGL